MASGSITSWQIDGETIETVRNFVLGSKITADGDCSLEIKRHLLFGRKAMKNLDSILKNRNIALLIKVCIIKPMVFPVVMYEYLRLLLFLPAILIPAAEKRRDTCICVTKSLCYTPETNTTLLINYTPI